MLIAKAAVEQGASAADPAAVAKAVHSTAHELSRWVGPDGCSALMTRALSRSGQEHTAMRDLKLVANSAPALVGVDESIEKNGTEAVAAGLATLLKELFELLRRVIGDDLTFRLAEQIAGVPFDTARDEKEGST